LLITLLALAAGTAQSATRVPFAPQVMGQIVLAGGGVSMNQAIAMVEKRFKARVVRSDVRQEGERRIYVLRLLDDSGNGKVVRVDASSGAIL
jgi:uncharacterized membrane protein YkoI